MCAHECACGCRQSRHTHRVHSVIPAFGTRHQSGNLLSSLLTLRVRVLGCDGTRDSAGWEQYAVAPSIENEESCCAKAPGRISVIAEADHVLQITECKYRDRSFNLFYVHRLVWAAHCAISHQFNQLKPLIRTSEIADVCGLLSDFSPIVCTSRFKCT